MRETSDGSPALIESLETRVVPTTITVTNLNNSGSGSLRQAMLNSTSGGTIVFDIQGGGTIHLSSALPIMEETGGLTIDGGNSNFGGITIDGGASSNATGDRVFFLGVQSGDNTGVTGTDSATWTIMNLTIANGNARGGNGGDGDGAGGGGGAGLGGAIFVNAGTLNLSNVSFINNRATGGNGGLDGGTSGSDAGGGGLGGNGSTAGFYDGGGGGGFGIGADGGNTSQTGAAGTFAGGSSGGMGRLGGTGGASGGGGGGSDPDHNGGGGGGGVGGGSADQAGFDGGAGGFGGGGGAGGTTGIGGSGGYGGGGGGSAGTGGTGGFGGGGGGNLSSSPASGGFAGGNSGSNGGGGGGGGALGGAVFVRKGAALNITGGGFSGDIATVGVGQSGGTNGQAIGTGIFLAGSVTYSVATGQTVTVGETLGGGSNSLISGGFTKSGAGNLVLTAANSYTGTTTINGGTLTVNGSLGSGTAVTVATGGILAGTGTLGGSTTVQSGGKLSPGNSIGILNSSNVVLASGSTYLVDLNGTTVGLQYDELNVTGTVNLGNATLAANILSTPAVGNSFTIINNDGSDAVSGTFNGLAEGATVTLGGSKFKISYVGGTGNDVVLTTLDSIPPSTVSFVRQTPSTSPTNADSIVFQATFNEAVTGVGTADFAVNCSTTATVTAVSGSGSVYNITVSGGNLASYNGTVGLNFSASPTITDLAGNALPNTEPSTDQTYVLDNTSPAVSITPNGTVTNASQITFTFQFSEIVTGFDISDVTVTNGTKGTFTAVDGDTYTLDVTPTVDGAVSVSVGANVATDAASNGNLAASASITSARSATTLSIAPNGTATNAASVTFTFQFGLTVTGFDATDVTVTNGTKGTFAAIDGDTYTLVVTPAADGPVSVSVAANAALDTVGNGNVTATASVNSDHVAPTLSISPNGTSSNAATTFTFQFSEPVTGFDATDVTVTNGTKGVFTAVDADTYTLIVSPVADGTMSVSVGANAASDLAGNGSAAAAASITIDRTAPSLSITPSGTLTSSQSTTFTFQFSKIVNGFTASDVTVTNGTLGSFTVVDGDTYTAVATAILDGTMTVQVAANAATDVSGNFNTAASTSITVQVAPPSLTITPDATSTSAASVTFTFQFGQTVTGFTASDVSVTNGTQGTFTAVDGDTYTLVVVPNGEGSLSVSVGADAASNAAGTGNDASSASITIDRTGPSLSITPSGTSTNASSISFSFHFSEVVTGFTAADITVTNGTKGSFSGSNGSYTLNVNPSADGAVTVSVPANAGHDAAGNGSLAATASVTSDHVSPSLTITPNGILTNAASTTFTFQFSEPVTGFLPSSINVTNGTKGTLATVDGTTFTMNVTPNGNGAVTVSVGANAAKDAARNGSTAGSASITVDRSSPSLTISPNGTTTNAAPTTFTFQFSEAVTGFDATDVTVANGTKGTFTAVDADTYTLVVTPAADGLVSVNVGANVAMDVATNGNTAASASITSDQSGPALTITPNGTTTNAASTTFTFTFSSSVTGFDVSDINLTNGTAGAFTAIGGSVYTLVVSPIVDGTVSVNVNANAAVDSVGNASLPGSASITVDRVAPTLTITPNGSLTNASSMTFTFQFSEPVTNFISTHVQVTNGTKGVFTAVDSDTYTFVVTPTADGTVTVKALASGASDLAGNASILTTASITSDRTSPSLTITPSGTLTNADTKTFTFQFNESVTGFDANDISVTNGTKGAFTAVDGDTYTLDVSPIADGTVSVNVAANIATDAATNGNTAASASITSDRTAPGLTITPNGTLTNAASTTFTFQFTEGVTGFAASDISVTNGTAGTFTVVDGDTYTLVVSPTGDGVVAVSVGANAANDAAGNGSLAATASITSDRTSPTLGITPNGISVNGAAFTFTFQFSEPVTGFTTSDISISGGTKGNFTAIDGDTYTLVVTPIANPVNISVAAFSLADLAGNTISSATNASVTLDNTAPSLTITPNGTLTNAASTTFTFQFSEAVTGFDVSDVTVTNGTTGVFTAVDADTYILVVAPVADGTVSVSVAANSAVDAATNGNTAATASITSDRTPPVLTITPNGTVTKSSPITFTFQWDSSVSGFDTTDVAVTNGTKGAFTTFLGNKYTLVVTPTADGIVSVNVGANAATDAAGNGNIATAASVTSDRTASSLSITPQGISTNAATTTFTFQFSEPVTGFDATDVAVTNGSKGTFTAVDASTYTLVVTPTASGTVSVSVAANAATDAATNGNTSATASITSDRTAPSLTITPNGTSTNAASPTLTFQFSETVTGFDASDVTLTNGTPGTFTAVDGDTYTLVVTPIADGLVSVSVGANAAADLASNGSTAASASFTSDHVAPTLNITPNGGITNAASTTFTFQFSEVVTGFTSSDITISGGTKGTFTAVDGDTYTLIVNSSTDGTYTVSVNANAATDAAGNGNTAASASIVIDRTSPALTISPNGLLTNAAPTTFTFQFSEVVTGFDASDITVTNGSKGTFTAVDGDTYTLVVTPIADGSVSVSVGSNAAADSASNGNTLASASITSDQTAPGLTITPNGTLTNAASTTFTFQFSSSVTGFDATDISVTNGTKGTFTALNAITYTLVVAPVADGNVSVSVAANAASDSVGNGSLTATASITSDRTAPSLSISPNGTVTNASPIVFTFQFSEAVTGFAATDITVTRGTKGTFTAVDGDTYTLVVTPTGDGIVTASVSANAANDLATNGNTAATASATSDRTAPTLSITPNGTVTNAASTTFTFQFSEVVTGFDASDLTLTNGTAGTFTAVDGDTYTLVVTPVVDGVVSVAVAASAAVDFGTNGNTAATASISSDRTAPSLSITPNGTLTNATSNTFTFQFNENVTGFTASDITVTNGTMGVFTSLNGSTYTLIVTPIADGVVTVAVGANAAADAATNGNTAATASITSDRTAPSLSITPTGAVTNATSTTFTFRFSEVVTGFVASDITVTNGTKGTFTAINGSTYSLVVTPIIDGNVFVSVSSNAANDAALNGNTAASASITSDRTAPSLNITPNGTITNTTSTTFLFQFSENVTGFDASDIAMANGTMGTFTQINGRTYTLVVSPTTDGIVSVSVNANAANDVAANGNTAASASITSDRTAPALTITPNGTVTNSNSTTFTFQFNEAVTGFDASDITVTNGTKGAFTAIDGDTYNLVVTPTADGVVSVSVNANSATDAASNGNLSAAASITSDRTAPALTITPNGTVTNSNSTTFTFQFNEAVTGFDASDITVTNGTKGTFTAIDSDTYTLVVTAITDGTVAVSVGANAANDVAANGNTTATASIVVDHAALVLNITPNGTVTNANSTTFTFKFTENVTGFDASDVSVTNGTKGAFTAIDASTFTLVVNPIADGAVSVSVNANAAVNAALNGNSAATASITSDRTAPSLSITPSGILSNAVSTTFTFQFNEVVSGFATSDITVTNGTKGAFTAVNGSTYTLVVTPVTDGTVSASVSANAANDAASNGNTAATASMTSDRTAPSLSISPNGTLTNAASTTFTFQFSEVVTGFAASDITVTNGTKEAFTSVDGETYTLIVTPDADGVVSVSVNAGAASDAAGNGNTTASASITSDRTSPALNITPNGILTNSTSTTFTFQFNEVVTGFDASDVTVTNGVKGAFSTIDGETYTLVVSPITDGAVSVNVVANAAMDAAGNGTSAASAAITSNRTAPALAITPNGTLTKAASTTFTFQFTTAMTGFDASDVNVTNGTIGDFTTIDGSTYTLVVTPIADGTVSVSVNAGVAVDVALNGNTAATASITSDRTAPSLSVTPDAVLSNANTTTFTFQFSEPVTGFDASNINVTNGTQGAFTAIDGETYTLVVSPISDGPVVVNVNANAAVDAATNGNFSASASETSDRTAPSLDITPDAALTNADATFTFQFTEAVMGFDANDIHVTNGTRGAFTVIDGKTYTLVVSPIADGPVVVDVNANAAVDAAANGNTAATASMTSDRSAPALSITPDGTLTNTDTTTFTFQFSESVTGFDASDINLTNGTKGTFIAVDGMTYTLVVAPITDGVVTVNVSANAASDAATNGNTVATASITSNRTSPALDITPSGTMTNAASTTFTFQFSAAMTGFDDSDVTVSNGTKGAFTTIDSSTYTLVVTPIADGSVSVSVNANVATNAISNGNEAASASITSDRTAPSLLITPDGTQTNAESTTFTFQFSEAVTGFDASDIHVTNGVKGTFTAINGGTYTLVVTPAVDGIVSVNVDPNVAIDSATNGNTSASAAITSVRTAPTLNITPDGTLTNAASILFTFQFSTAVTGFDVSDIRVTNGTQGTFTAIDPATYTLLVTPDADGLINVTVNANAASDDTANGNLAAAASIVSDRSGPVFTSSASSSVSENSTTVITVAAVDAHGPVTYAIQGGADSDKFAIDMNSGTLRFIAPPDFENPTDSDQDNSYNVQVSASDTLGQITTQSLIAMVTPLNDLAAIFSSPTTFNVTENSPTVGTVVATDGDLPAQSVTFGITGGDDAELFSIDGSSGVLTFNQAPDFEAPTDMGQDNVYNLEVTASDGAGLTSIQAIAVMVTPVNDNSPVFTSPAALQVAENVADVGTVSATDADLPSQTVSFHITGGVDASRFSITSAGVLKFNSTPDFEVPQDFDGNNIYDLQVTADDGAGRATIQNIAVTVTPVNDNSPVFSSPATIQVPENVTAVETVSATDADSPAQTMTYSLSGGADLSKFSITSGGVLKFNTAPDYEAPTDSDANNVYELQITANDGAGRTTVQNLSVSVTPVNDNAPVFSSSAQFQVPENSTSVGSVIATDLDSPTQNVTYLITGGADAAKFSLASSGQLQFNSAPDFEAPTDANGNNVYELQVTANDGHGLTTTQNISVTVTNANEAPQLVLGGSDVTWTKKRPPNAITVLPEVTVVGNGDLAGGTLSISMDAKGTKRKLLDTLTIPSTAALGTSSGLVNTSGHLTLQIQLGANVTSASIESFLRGITFSTKGSAMRVLTRSVHLTLSNAAGQSSSVTQTIQVHKKAHRA